MPYLAKLIEACQNKDKGTIVNLVKKGKEAIAKELGEIKKCYSASKELSFIPKCLLGFVEDKIQEYRKMQNRESLAESFIGGTKVA